MLNAHDRDIIERDPAIRGLTLVLQPSRLGKHDCRLKRNPADVNYLRYKPGTNCVARFRYGDRVGYVKAFSKDPTVKVAKAMQRFSADVAGGVGRLFLDEPNMLVSFFPNDAKLNALARLENARNRQQLLSQIFKSDTSWRDARVTTLNYKPERRYVARLDHPDGRISTLKFFSRREFATTLNAHESLRFPKDLQLPKVLCASEKNRAIAFEWLPGETLNQYLAEGRTAEVGSVGASLAQFHMTEQPALVDRRGRDPLLILSSISSQLSWLDPGLAETVDQIANELRHWHSNRNPVLRPIHGDFYDRQVIIQGSGVGFIDIDNVRMGDPLEDLGCFLAHMERRSTDRTLDPEAVGRASRDLRRSYESAASFVDLSDLDMHTAFHLFKLAPHAFRDRRPDWPEQIEQLLSHCQRLILATKAL